MTNIITEALEQYRLNWEWWLNVKYPPNVTENERELARMKITAIDEALAKQKKEVQ